MVVFATVAEQGSLSAAARALGLTPSAVSRIIARTEQRLGTRYTVDTLAKLVRRYPKRRFVWLMGSDNLAQLHRWKDWRRIATRYDRCAKTFLSAVALAATVMFWL